MSTGDGQTSLDSLLKIDQTQQPVRNNVFTNINLSREYFVLGDYENGTIYGVNAVNIAQGIGNDTLIGQASFFAALNWYEVNPDSGFYYYEKSIDLLIPLKHDWATFAINNLCTEFTERSWYSEALKYRIKSLPFFEEKRDTVMLIHTLVRIGYIHDRIGDFYEALKWYDKAQPIANLQGDIEGLANVYAYRGIAYDELEMFDSAHFYNQKAIAIFKEVGDYYSYGIWCSNIGNTYLKQGNYELAEEYLLESLKKIEDQDENSKTIKLVNLSKVFYHQKKYVKGDSTLLTAISIATKYDQHKFLSEAYLTYSESLESRGLFERAVENYKLHNAHEDTTFNEEKANQIAYHNAKFNIQEKEKELLLQKNKSQRLENEKLLLDLELSNRNFLIISLAGLLTIGAFLGIFIILRNKRRLEKEKNEALLEEKDRGIEAVISAQESERMRIARELHDGIVQELILVKKQLNTLAKDKGQLKIEEIDRIAEEVDKSAQEVRNISHELMPFALKELGFVAALEDMLEKVLRANDITYDINIIGLDKRLPSRYEIALYRIAQELINNVVKHSEATEIEILLTFRNQMITFRLEDNGIGIKKNQKGGIGLQSIKSRLTLLQGVFKVEQESNAGMVAIVRIPFTEKN